MSIQKLKEISDEMAESKRKLAEFAKTEGRSAIGAAFAPLFEPPTNLVRITWCQYTPYFNDGDACVFRVNDPELTAEIDGEEKDFDMWSVNHSEYGLEGRAALGEKTVAELNKLWSSIGDEILEAVFGDHVRVEITKDEVVVTDYEHD